MSSNTVHADTVPTWIGEWEIECRHVAEQETKNGEQNIIVFDSVWNNLLCRMAKKDTVITSQMRIMGRKKNLHNMNCSERKFINFR